MMAGDWFYMDIETDSGTASTKTSTTIELLDDWMSTPDDLGDDWWTKFRAEFQRFKLR